MNMSKYIGRLLFSLCLLTMPLGVHAQGTTPETLQSMAAKFPSPGQEYGPHVWWHWMGPNFSKEGITKDLEAMKECGIGGATIFNITSSVQESHSPMENNPWPSQTYRSEAYWEAMEHTMKEARRLGLKIGLHGTPGYSLTGGPWIDEERGMKALISSKIVIDGGQVVETLLPRPELPEFTGYDSKYTEDYQPHEATKYWDETVIAVRCNADPTVCDVVDITEYMDAEGRLVWSAPEGRWAVYRYGYAPTMGHPHPVPDDIIGKVLEVDKMSREANQFHWQQLLEPLKEHIGAYFGDTFVYIWVDSYEAGYQNWTPGFRQEFIRIKGYDPMPWIALYQLKNNKELEYHFSAHTSSKFESEMPEFKVFLKDYDDVVNRLFIDNGWYTAKEMLRQNGLKFYWEPYGGPFSNYEGAMIADIPVGEFWSSETFIHKNPNTLRAAVDYSKRIVGAEALTGPPFFSRYNEDPAYLRHAVNGGYACGYNLFFLHHWVHQPFDDKYQPGLGMGWWGSHFGRFQTWYEPGKAFFTYMARCQMLLQQGSFVESEQYMAHRRTPEADIFFVTNTGDEVQTTYSFPVTGRAPELWDPYRGTITASSRWRCEGENTLVDLDLAKDDAMIVVFPCVKGGYAVQPELRVVKQTEEIIKGPWDVVFSPKLDQPFKWKFSSLVDWCQMDDPRLKYFAGTARYEKTVNISAEDLGSGKRVVLDLGELHDIAELEINGRKAGVLWSPPYDADITKYLKPGKNQITILVTNNWANRLIGDEQYSADFEWGQDRGDEGRAMKSFPEWFLNNEPRPSQGRKTFNIWYYYRKDSPLFPAGLLGPVRLIKEHVE